MARDVVAAEPFAAEGFAGETGGDGGEVGEFVQWAGVSGSGNASPAGGGEAAVDEGGAEEPLRGYDPG